MTTGLKISDAQLKKMMRDLLPFEADPIDSFSRAVWSLITEPGDTFAAALITTLGAKTALECELQQISANRYAGLLQSAGFEDHTGDRFKNLGSLLQDARERWHPG